MKFSRLEYLSTKWGSDLQTFKQDILKNLGLQISGISRQQTFSMLVSIGAQIHICTMFCCKFYHTHHLWLHHCCWPDHSQNSCHKQLELLILSVQECMVTSRIFRSQSFFRFLTQCQKKAEICSKAFWKIR